MYNQTKMTSLLYLLSVRNKKKYFIVKTFFRKKKKIFLKKNYLSVQKIVFFIYSVIKYVSLLDEIKVKIKK